MKKIKKTYELKEYFDALIKQWDYNRNGEKDKLSVSQNCLLNAVGVYMNFKELFSNKIKICSGSWTINSDDDDGHFWNKMKINGKWEIVDITFYYYNNSLKIPDYLKYKEDVGGYVIVENRKVYKSDKELKQNLYNCMKRTKEIKNEIRTDKSAYKNASGRSS